MVHRQGRTRRNQNRASFLSWSAQESFTVQRLQAGEIGEVAVSGQPVYQSERLMIWDGR